MTSPVASLVAELGATPARAAALDVALAAMTPQELAALWFHWPFWARAEQLAPRGEWDTWLLCTGLGFGKTRSGAEWIRARVESGDAEWIGLVGPTAADVRDTMVEGESGLLACSPPWFRPVYEPSKRRLTWPNGATATCFSAEEPDRLRGPNLDTAWCDELAAWANLETAWQNLEGRMRRGPSPRVCVTTTPRPLALLRSLAADPTTRVVRGSSRANAANVPERYRRRWARYDGTEYGRQEIEGEILDDRQGAMFSGAWIKRIPAAPELVRVAVGIDPAVSTSRRSDETGIIAAGVDAAGALYVLEDGSGKYTPEAWARRAIEVFDANMADVVIAEISRGGDFVASTIRAALRAKGRREIEVQIETVHATRGKALRAEPVAALYEQGRVFHVGSAERFERLEKQMIEWDPASSVSPDRVDAMVWAVTHLALGETREMSSEGLPAPGARLDPLPERSAVATAIGDGWADEVGGRFL